MAQPSDKFGGKLPQVPCPLVESFWVHPASSVQQDWAPVSHMVVHSWTYTFVLLPFLTSLLSPSLASWDHLPNLLQVPKSLIQVCSLQNSIKGSICMPRSVVGKGDIKKKKKKNNIWYCALNKSQASDRGLPTPNAVLLPYDICAF